MSWMFFFRTTQQALVERNYSVSETLQTTIDARVCVTFLHMYCSHDSWPLGFRKSKAAWREALEGVYFSTIRTRK